ncbi:MAG TPA: D-alanyl-D-alanine carboxypeptidase, partial [Anaerolineales bacterium]
ARLSLVALALGLYAACMAAPAIAAGFSAMVVDAHTGKVLFSQNADETRHPASLTKVMTLYILFEELKAERLKLNSPLKCSAHGASRPPSRLGLRPGDTVTVEDAIKSLVTRSANDVAATIAENISGSEKAFAVRMTNTARVLGMTRTTFRNASGLPDPKQVTTARDMATLGLRIQRDFPQYYPYFRTTSFSYKGTIIRSHNRLVGKYQGTDGIKTGYIRASGYNLTTSVARKGKRLVGVVMGGKTGAARNAYMMKMLDKYFSKASSSRVNTIAAVAGTPPGLDSKESVALGAPITAGTGSPIPVPQTKPSSAVASAGEAVQSTADVTAPATAAAPVQKQQDTLPQTGGELAMLLPESSGSQETSGTEEDAEGEHQWPVSSSVSKEHLRGQKEVLATDSLFKIAAAAAAEVPESTENSPGQARAEAEALLKPKRSWQIQIGAYPTKDGAMRIIEKALSMGIDPLEGKTAFAIAITRGNSTLYRARFSGFNQTTAREACKVLERKGLGCLPLAPQG